MTMLDVKNLKKIYGSNKGEVKTEALKNINFSVEEGEFVAIMGESGSGKTTLLNIIATLDKPTNGQVVLNEIDLLTIKDKKVSDFRRKKLGFVFQEFNLLDLFSNKDNILLPLVLSGEKVEKMENKLMKIASTLGIKDILKKYPHEISGGQKQRVAIARALITNPSIVLADEPTGSLDSNSSKIIMHLFEEVNQKGQTVMMVTHSVRSAAHAKRVLFIKDGVIYHEIYKGEDSVNMFMDRITHSLSMLTSGVDSYEK